MQKLLIDRENRSHYQEELQDTGKVLVVLKVNWPGEDKKNKTTDMIVQEVSAHIEGYKEVEIQNTSEGKIYFYLFDDEGQKIKDEMVHLEENHALGRLVDIDVYQNNKQFKRDELRKCIICDDPAFVCMRAQNHTPKEVLSAMKKIVKDYEN